MTEQVHTHGHQHTHSEAHRRGEPHTHGERYWEEFYATINPAWGTRPNAVLVDVVGSLHSAPGRALDLGCGHGGDALWLASLGWQVTAVDASEVALARVTRAAQDAGLADAVAVEQHDLRDSLPSGAFDLVTASYFHVPQDVPRSEILHRAAQLVAPGGLLLVVEHASVSPWSWDQDATFPTPAESLASFDLGDDWSVERLNAPRRIATGPEGQLAEVTDNVIAVRRSH